MKDIVIRVAAELKPIAEAMNVLLSEAERALGHGRGGPDPSLQGAEQYHSMREALDALGEMLRSKKAEERERAEALLVDYLRRHPGAAAELIDILDRSTQADLDQSTQLVLMDSTASPRSCPSSSGCATFSAGRSATAPPRPPSSSSRGA